jgi:hypothetical protein
MSEAPLFAKRTKSKTIRAREETKDVDSEESKTPISNFRAKNKTRSKPQQRLSFNDEVSLLKLRFRMVYLLLPLLLSFNLFGENRRTLMARSFRSRSHH